MAEHPNFSTAFEGGTYLVTTAPEKKYKQIELIGEGGYGAVLLCKRKRDRKLYAVKIIAVEEEKEDLRAQLKEMEILASLQDCPYIVGFVECLFVKHTRIAEWLVKDLKTDRHLWCVMELCGKDMWHAMKDIGHALSAKQVLSVAAQVRVPHRLSFPLPSPPCDFTGNQWLASIALLVRGICRGEVRAIHSSPLV